MKVIFNPNLNEAKESNVRVPSVFWEFFDCAF